MPGNRSHFSLRGLPLKLRSFALLVLMPVCPLVAQITLPKVLSSHMVVQRDLPVHVWGFADPNGDVRVTFRGESRSTHADHLGQWSVYLSPGGAGGPFDLTVREDGNPATGSNASAAPVVLSDVVVGDVWLASGQSNMEFPMSRS